MSLAAIIGDFERVVASIFQGKAAAVVGEPKITITADQAKQFVDAWQSFPFSSFRAFADHPSVVGAIDVTEEVVAIAEQIDPTPVLKVADMALKLAALAVVYNRSALPGVQLNPDVFGGDKRRGSGGG